jgi:phosphohistidine swiveling domain-containing protein
MANPTVSNFPIPTDLVGHWVWEKLHCPRPVTPLEQDVLVRASLEGFDRSMIEIDSIIRLGCRFINNYLFVSFVRRDLDAESREAKLASGRVKVAELLPRIGALWEKEWLPSILPGLEKARTTDFSRLSDEELLSTFDEMAAGVVDRWAIHGKLNYAFYSASLFSDFYRAELQPEDETEGYEALQGFPSIALESSRHLWRLSRLARSNPQMRLLFEEAEPGQLLTELKATVEGSAFLYELGLYLEEYGWRTDSVFELTKPAWREDPTIALNSIQGYINIDDDRGPDSQFREAVRHREELLANARRRLASEPAKLAHFNELYEIASSFTPIAEDHNHYIDQMGDLVMRYPALEIGRRLVERGSIVETDDVFLLHVAEIKDAMQGTDQKALAEARRSDLAYWAQIMPPLSLGSHVDPSGDPAEEFMTRFFGSPVELSGDPLIITGRAASPGTARGPAKVVRDLAEASKVSPGDILVCETTLPPWTPLFATIAAVVADTGGVLSHCAIVAREYCLPAVVSTGIGTTKIKDGMIITVDGSKGTVRIESA